MLKANLQDVPITGENLPIFHPERREQTKLDRMTTASNKAHQLGRLLSVMYGQGQEWVDEMGSANRDALIWIAADLAEEIENLIDGKEHSHA